MCTTPRQSRNFPLKKGATIAHITMYLDPRFKLLPTLTEQQNRAVQSTVKVELTTPILLKRESTIQNRRLVNLNHYTLRTIRAPSTQTCQIRKKFLMVLSDHE